MFLCFLLINLAKSIRYEGFDLIKTIPGNWTHFDYENSKIDFSIFMFQDEENNSNDLQSFTGFYKDTLINISVTSEKSIQVIFDNISISLNFSLSLEGTAFANTILPNGNHMTVGVFTRSNIEITIVDKETETFHVFGFRKIVNRPYTFKDFFIPTSIAIVIMFLLHKFSIAIF